jgi:hypothetical protein
MKTSAASGRAAVNERPFRVERKSGRGRGLLLWRVPHFLRIGLNTTPERLVLQPSSSVPPPCHLCYRGLFQVKPVAQMAGPGH